MPAKNEPRFTPFEPDSVPMTIPPNRADDGTRCTVALRAVSLDLLHRSSTKLVSRATKKVSDAHASPTRQLLPFSF
jgi:hypothetical protein